MLAFIAGLASVLIGAALGYLIGRRHARSKIHDLEALIRSNLWRIKVQDRLLNAQDANRGGPRQMHSSEFLAGGPADPNGRRA